MIYSKEIALQTAQYLLQIKAIKLSFTNPFEWASGWKSPIYCDNRVILSYPKIRNFIRDKLSEIIRTHYLNAEVVSGVATGAIAHGILASDILKLPFVYVRPSAKGHGLKNQIEGKLEINKKVVIIEDLISTGSSSLQALNAIKNNGNDVLGMAAIFTYGFTEAENNFSKKKCQLYTLCDYQLLLEYAKSVKYISSEECDSLEQWNKNPEGWN